jgi:hypothetical protein
LENLQEMNQHTKTYLEAHALGHSIYMKQYSKNIKKVPAKNFF